MLQNEFENHVMFCNSTGVQTVNLLPALQLNCKHLVIISTPFTEKNGLTERLIQISQKYNITSDIEKVEHSEEKNLSKLTDKLIQIAKNYRNILWNVSGGQKIPSAAMFSAFQKRIVAGFDDDYVTYLEANPPEIWRFRSDYESINQKTSVLISLNDILYLSGYTTLGNENMLYPNISKENRKNLDIGKKAFQYYKESEYFREAFFSYMKPSISYSRTQKDIHDMIKKVLNDIKPNVKEIRVSKEGYKDLEKNIGEIISGINNVKNREDLQKLIQPLKIIMKPSEIYNDYWNQIKKVTIELLLERIEADEVRLIKSDLNKRQIKQLIEQIQNIGGKIENHQSDVIYKKHLKSFSSFRSNGFLFEWMVAAAILEEIEINDRLKNSISEVYHSVKTKKLDSDREDAEHDIVLITSFGTLIIIELKTYEFSGNTAQAQESLAYKKSGPYGTAMIIGPLFSNMINRTKNGQKETPHYIDRMIKTQEETAIQNGIQYYYLDQITDMLNKKLFI